MENARVDTAMRRHLEGIGVRHAKQNNNKQCREMSNSAADLQVGLSLRFGGAAEAPRSMPPDAYTMKTTRATLAISHGI